MSLDAEAIKQELQQLNHQRHEVNERLRSMAPTRGRGGFRGGRGPPPPALAHPSARRDYPPRDHPPRDYPPRDHDSRDMGRDMGGFARERHNPLDRLPPRRPFPGRGGPWEQEPPHLEAPPEVAAPRRRVQSAVVVEGSAHVASDSNGREPREYADGGGSSERGGRSGYDGGSGSGAGGGGAAGGKRPAEGELLEDNPALKRRNRRLFGALLGTLQKFKEETQRESSSDVAQRRAELLQRAEQKKEEAARRLREEARQEMQSKRMEEVKRKREINMLSDTKRLELLYAEKLARHDRLSAFLKTKAGPSVLWRPRQHSHVTLRLQEQQRQELQLWKAEQLEQLEREKAELRERYERATSRGEGLGQEEGPGHGEGEEGQGHGQEGGEEEGHEGEGGLAEGMEGVEGGEGQRQQQQQQELEQEQQQEQPAADDRYEAEPRGEGDEQQAEEGGEAEKGAVEGAVGEGPAGDGEQQAQEQPSSPAAAH